MKSKYAFILLALAVSGYVTNRWHGASAADASGARRVMYYRDPMHPAYTSAKPGVAPDCGMQLEAVYAEPAAAPARQPDVFQVPPEQQRLAGVRTVGVKREATTHRFRLPGRVVADERSIYRLSAKVDGWVREIFPPGTGTLVTKGQLLVSVFSRDYRMAQQSYAYALNNEDRTRDSSGTFDAVEQNRFSVAETLTTLQNMGVDPAQIAEIAKSRQPQFDTRLTAPASGLVTVRNVFPNQHFDAGAELYRIVDLSRVWIVVDLFANEAQYLRPGMPVRVLMPGSSRPRVMARVGDVLPQFDSASRGLKLRLEADNPGLALRPDVLVSAEVDVTFPPATTVPVDAVVDTGLQHLVFVDHGGGTLERRAVQTGWRYDNDVEILEGLRPGDRVVSAATFLIDSESRLQGLTW
jgi:Cu(I)/Ag(I) efflux system membrane fusion protein